MLFFDGVAGLLFLALWIFCIVDVITTPEHQVRNLPKIVWLIVVVLLVDIGSIAWLIAGRTWGAAAGTPLSRNVRTGSEPRWATLPEPSSAAPAARRKPANPDDDEEFLAQLRARAEEQRRRAREGEQGPEVPPDPV